VIGYFQIFLLVKIVQLLDNRQDIIVLLSRDSFGFRQAFPETIPTNIQNKGLYALLQIVRKNI
jgi:hypothetical protein